MPIQGIRGCLKAYHTVENRRECKATYWASFHTDRGLDCLRPVTPLPPSEWTSSSTPVHLNSLDMYLIVFPRGPMLPQMQVFDLLGGLAYLQFSLTQLLLDTERFHLGEELIDLGQSGLALLIEGLEAINFGHVSPVVLGKSFEPSMKRGKCGGRAHECGKEPHRESSRHIIFPPGVDWGVEVDDDREIREGIPGHLSLIYVLDPSGWTLHSIMTGEFNGHLPSILDVPIWWGREGLLCNRGLSCQGPHS
jgi:hypothetical protein